MAHEAVKAAGTLAREGIDAEVIDLRTAKPLDRDLVLESVSKTGRLVIADGGWKTCGLAAEIAALVAESIPQCLRCPVKRVVLPDAPAPASSQLEKEYYPDRETISLAVRQVMFG